MRLEVERIGTLAASQAGPTLALIGCPFAVAAVDSAGQIELALPVHAMHNSADGVR